MCPHHFETTVPTPDTEHPAYEAHVFGFAILWLPKEPHRIAEVGLCVPFETLLIGRGVAGLKAFLRFGRHRPGGPPVIDALEWCLLDSFISREQLRVTGIAGGIDMFVAGSCPTFVNGKQLEQKTSAKLVEGDIVELKGSALFLVVKRQRVMPALEHGAVLHPFGEADSVGTVGESPAWFGVRVALALAASRHNHVALLGESGTGKEHIAEGIHKLSSRAKKAWVAKNAAAIPEGVAEAELFGCKPNYPNAGTAETEGMLTAAEGGTAFLDEIGALKHDLQQKLLRVLSNGDFQRLGESRTRLLTALVVVATSAEATALKLDFVKRFARMIRLPPLRERKEDIPLILRFLILCEAARYPDDLARFLEKGVDGKMYPRVSSELVAALVRHDLPGNVRDVYGFLLMALAEHPRGDCIGVPQALKATAGAPASKAPPSSLAPPSPAPAPSGTKRKHTREEIVAALEQTRSASRASKWLGVARSTLRDRMKEYGLNAKDYGISSQDDDAGTPSPEPGT